MVIVKLIGGLGNQLFQYAMGRRLAEMHNSVLKIDISFFETYKLHSYSLHSFNIKEVIASQAEVLALTTQKQGVVGRAMLKLSGKLVGFGRRSVEEKHFHFNSEILSLPDDVYLDGYWQSEKYFSDITDILQKEFSLKNLPAGKDKELLERIASCESVCIHVRRGDYVSNSQTLREYGVCPVSYYSEAVAILTESIKTPHFFVFSDDIKWSRENLVINYPVTFVSHNGPDKNYEDLRLMSTCKHQIIANSSFSWWCAWLNQNPQKIIIAPKKWFNSSLIDTRDLIPAGWLRL